MADLQTDANKQVVRRFLQAIVDGDLGTVDALLHPDVKWWIIGFGDLDRAALIHGIGGLIAADKRLMNVTGMIAEGDSVAFEAAGEMVYPGKVYRNNYHNVMVVQNGIIVQGREYMDTQAAMAFMAG